MSTTEWPEGALYHSPLGLFPFQEEHIAQDYLDTIDGGGKLVVWDTGTGKSHMAMRMSTLLAEDALDGTRPHDLTILLCESGKMGEWVADYREFTRLDVRKYHGPNRKAMLAKHGLPQVLVTTYETARIDLVKVNKPAKGKRGMTLSENALFDQIKDLSVLWIMDESAAKVANSSSDLWKGFDWVFRRMRKAHPKDHRVFGLTATPMERNWENAFHQARLISPDHMPLVKEFEEWFVSSRHPVYGTANYRLSVMHTFAEMMAPLLDRKRKTDPDVIAQFPKRTESLVRVEMAPDQAALYSMVEELQDTSEADIPGLWTLLRQIAGHPASVPISARLGTSKVCKMLVDELGEEYFNGISSAKSKELLVRLEHVVKERGEKAVVFTFFGPTMIPVLAKEMRAKKIKVYENHAGLTPTEQHNVKMAFRSDPGAAVFLTSDIAARGVNLPEATEVFEYESALTYANRTQRLDRIHRITSTSTTSTCTTLLVEATVEVPIIEKVMDRNRAQDVLLGDEDAGEDFMTGAERKKALQINRLTKTSYKRKKPDAA